MTTGARAVVARLGVQMLRHGPAMVRAVPDGELTRSRRARAFRISPRQRRNSLLDSPTLRGPLRCLLSRRRPSGWPVAAAVPFTIRQPELVVDKPLRAPRDRAVDDPHVACPFAELVKAQGPADRSICHATSRNPPHTERAGVRICSRPVSPALFPASSRFSGQRFVKSFRGKGHAPRP